MNGTGLATKVWALDEVSYLVEINLCACSLFSLYHKSPKWMRIGSDGITLSKKKILIFPSSSLWKYS